MLFLTAKRDVTTKYWKKYITRYDGLEMSKEAKELLHTAPWQFKKCTNGVGSNVGIFNKLVMRLWLPIFRNCLLFLNITPASDVHDVEYSLKLMFKTLIEGTLFKRQTDLRFYHNMLIIIRRQLKPNWIDFLPYGNKLWRAIEIYRKKKAWIYYEAVKDLGNTSFWDGKQKPTT